MPGSPLTWKPQFPKSHILLCNAATLVEAAGVHGGVAERSMAADCKSAGFILRWFKSNSLHHQAQDIIQVKLCGGVRIAYGVHGRWQRPVHQPHQRVPLWHREAAAQPSREPEFYRHGQRRPRLF